MGFWEKVLPGYKGYKERENSRNTDKLFREFLGRDPDPNALLERNLGALRNGRMIE